MTVTLSDLRKRAGFSQAQMSERMGVSKTQVSRIEATYPDIMFTTLRRYLDALDVEIRFLGDGVIDAESSEVEKDGTRIYAETRKQDPTRQRVR
jgi:transcriptional regulator with XRE-family HTH domain